MSNNMLNCAVIGLGIGEEHVRALLAHPQVQLSAVCDVNHNRVSQVLTKYQLNETLHKSFDEIINDRNIHLVSIASFDDVHFAQVMACLQNGKHVFVEKPLCQTAEQLTQIYYLWRKQQNLGLASNLLLRKAPLYTWLAKQIKLGVFGNIYAMDMDYLYGRIQKITEGWRGAVDHYSVMAGGGIHLIDLMARFVGERPVHVQSAVNKIATYGTAFRYHDFHTALFAFKNNIIARITANFGCMHRHQHVVRIFGTKATFFYDDMGARIAWTRAEDIRAEQLTFAPKPSHKGMLLLDFVEDILNHTPNRHTQSEFDVMSMVIAADHAVANDGQPLLINYLVT